MVPGTPVTTTVTLKNTGTVGASGFTPILVDDVRLGIGDTELVIPEGALTDAVRASIEADPGRRKQLVWAIERKLAEEGARPIIFYSRGGTCWQPYIKGLTIMVNSIYNGWRMEDVWLDR